MNFYISLTFCLFFSQFAFAEPETILEYKKEFLAYQDTVTPDSILLISTKEKKARTWNLKKKAFTSEEMPVDKDCLTPGMIYVHPFLVDITHTCFIDSGTKQIESLPKTVAPKDHYSFIYFQQDDQKLYFLVNGRDFPKAKHGYVKVKVVLKDKSSAFIQDLITEVPGFSGGMARGEDADSVYFVAATGQNTNNLFKLANKGIKDLITMNKTYTFKNLSEKVHGPFEGMSSRLFTKGSDLFFYNKTPFGEYESFTLNKKEFTRTKVEIPMGLELFGVNGEQLLYYCSEKGILQSTK